MSEWKPKVGDMVQTKPMEITAESEVYTSMSGNSKVDKYEINGQWFRVEHLQPVALSADGGSVDMTDGQKKFELALVIGEPLQQHVDVPISVAVEIIEALTAAGFAVVRK